MIGVELRHCGKKVLLRVMRVTIIYRISVWIGGASTSVLISMTISDGVEKWESSEDPLRMQAMSCVYDRIPRISRQAISTSSFDTEALRGVLTLVLWWN